MVEPLEARRVLNIAPVAAADDFSLGIDDREVGEPVPIQGPNGHYYEYVSDTKSWHDAIDDAALRTFGGVRGHLVTITDQAEQDFILNSVTTNFIWGAGTDEGNNGTWKWSAGPEADTIFWQEGVGTVTYSYWANNNPKNNPNTTQDYLLVNWTGSGEPNRKWNDTGSAGPYGYVVEYSIPDPLTLIVATNQGVLANDTDDDDDPLTAELVDDVQHGSLTLDEDGSFVYTPVLGYEGDDTFTYMANDGTEDSNLETVTISVNSPPTAVADEYSVNEDELLDVDVLLGVRDNDVDEDLTNLFVELVDSTTQGVLNLAADGSFTYAPSQDFFGTDTFTYSVSDGFFDSNVATVTITVDPVAEQPMAVSDDYIIGIGDVAPGPGVPIQGPNGNYYEYVSDVKTWHDASDDAETRMLDGVRGHLVTITNHEEQEFIFNNVTSNFVWGGASDQESNGTWKWVVGPEAGTVFWQPADGTVTYSYWANNNPKNNPGTTQDYLLVNWTGSGEPNRKWVDAGPVGPFGYIVEYSIPESSILTVDAADGVLANDIDPDGAGLTAVLVDDAQNGSLLLNDDGSFTYTPDSGFEGIDSFTYKASAAGMESDIATVSIDVKHANHEPVAQNDGFSIVLDTSLLTGDSLQNEYVEVVEWSANGHGYAVIQTNLNWPYAEVAARELRYRGVQGYLATVTSLEEHTFLLDNFTPGMTDGFLIGLSDAEVEGDYRWVTGEPFTFTDWHPNQPHNISNSDYVGFYPLSENNWGWGSVQGTSVSHGYLVEFEPPYVVGILDNDQDADGHSLTTTLVDDVENGTLTLEPNGAFLYVPEVGFTGTVEFSYRVNDGTYDSNIATATITVSAPPVAQDDQYALPTGGGSFLVPAVSGVLANDDDAEDDPLTAMLVDLPAHGMVQLNPDGSFEYSPGGSFELTDSFTYRANDGVGDSNVATVSIALDVPLIEVGDHVLQANTPGQTIEILVTGGQAVAGIDLFVQIGDGGPELADIGLPAGTDGPEITGAELKSGTIFAGVPDSATDLGSIPQVANWSLAIAGGGDVPADGRLVTLTIDTTGFFDGTWDLLLSDVLPGHAFGPFATDFAGTPVHMMNGSLTIVPATVVGRNILYNDSKWDGEDPAATAGDDAGIAVDKAPLLPGQTATFTNYSSYAYGINGIVLDIAGLLNPASVSVADFEFHVGRDNDTATWDVAPPPTFAVRPGEGAEGSDRVTFVWENNAIEQEWLQVRVKASENTGLVTDDVFYFGSAIGETGNNGGDTLVTSPDVIGARDHQRGPFDPAPIDDVYDFNRDRLVTSIDVIIARDNQVGPIGALPLITPPLESPPAASAAYAASGEGQLAYVEAAASSVATVGIGGSVPGEGNIPRAPLVLEPVERIVGFPRAIDAAMELSAVAAPPVLGSNDWIARPRSENGPKASVFETQRESPGAASLFDGDQSRARSVADGAAKLGELSQEVRDLIWASDADWLRDDSMD